MIVIALGSNLHSAFGTPEETLHHAVDTLSAQFESLRAVSRFWRSQAWPDPHDPPFANAVASIATSQAPDEVLARLHQIEERFGRERSEIVPKNAPRTLDLDLIDYDGLVQAGPPELPHPRMHERAFVLVPLREIAPAWRHPVTGKTVDEMIAALPRGTSDVEPL